MAASGSSESIEAEIIETFAITGRGTVVVIDVTTSLPVAEELAAKVTRPDGSKLSASAFKEWLLRRTSEPLENEAFLLRSIDKAEIPLHSRITWEVRK
ncbi:hypothetical protein [uncultured Brevundimonas sp.]|uniref:hypothetical protein n=1 Tax=uncultured Brevundimonas sp. TaxID=213418 RepID=UPI002612E113|nr:hypothetical protein [uncultured Brevundimonas sp.]